jgi:hypothetical protein
MAERRKLVGLTDVRRSGERWPLSSRLGPSNVAGMKIGPSVEELARWGQLTFRPHVARPRQVGALPMPTRAAHPCRRCGLLIEAGERCEFCQEEHSCSRRLGP